MAMWRQLTAIKQVETAFIGENELDRSLGPWALSALGIGAIISTGIFVLTGVAAANNAGPALMLSFVVAAAVCGLAALCYAEFASLIPASGSAYRLCLPDLQPSGRYLDPNAGLGDPRLHHLLRLRLPA